MRFRAIYIVILRYTTCSNYTEVVSFQLGQLGPVCL